MNITCHDRDRIFESGTPAEWVAFEFHAASCRECAAELRAWKAISVAAREMREYTEAPGLWPRIERALAAQAQASPRRLNRWNWSWNLLPIAWQAAAVGAFILLLGLSGGLLYFYEIRTPHTADSHFLKNRALANVERTESAYIEAIDKLAAEAKPQLDAPATPLLANYKEKLLLLDSAISDLRTQEGLNPSNAHLRYQLLAMYQEKQHTLEEILEDQR
jgi:hypothetical protein